MGNAKIFKAACFVIVIAAVIAAFVIFPKLPGGLEIGRRDDP